MKQTVLVAVVKIDNHYSLLYKTFEGKYFIPSHIAGHVVEITKEEATKLLN